MHWKLDKHRALCPQICQQLSAQIASGEFQTEQRIPSVRELAADAGVNPNTVQHALTLLEEKGILHSERGSGWYVADISAAKTLCRQMALEMTAEFFRDMTCLGFSQAEILQIVKEWEQ